MTVEQLPASGLLTTSEQVVAGNIDTTTPTISQGTGFTLTKNGTGWVTVTFTTAFSTTPSVIPVVSSAFNANRYCWIYSASTTSVIMQRYNQGVGLEDGAIHFIAYIPSTSKTRVPRDFGLVTAIPTTPTPGMGDTCTYTDSLTAPTYAWQLLYDASQVAANKWLCIGGSPVTTKSDVLRSSTSTTYVSPATDPLSFTLPLAGDYDITLKSRLEISGSEREGWHSYDVGGTAASDTWAVDAGFTNVAGVRGNAGGSVTNRHTGLSASTVIAEKIKVATPGTVNVSNRRLWAIPVRVG